MSTVTIELVHEECWVCGAPFALSKTISYKRRMDGKTFTCPNNGCQIRYSTPSELATARKELEEAKGSAARWEARCAEQRARCDRLERSANGLRGYIVQLKRKAKKP